MAAKTEKKDIPRKLGQREFDKSIAKPIRGGATAIPEFRQIDIIPKLIPADWGLEDSAAEAFTVGGTKAATAPNKITEIGRTMIGEAAVITKKLAINKEPHKISGLRLSILSEIHPNNGTQGIWLSMIAEAKKLP